MPPLLEATDCRDTLARLERLTPEHRPQWGRMSVGQMLCHLSDYFEVALGRAAAKPFGNVLTQALACWAILSLGMRFPRNVRTLPEFRATSPEAFQRDRARLRDLMQQFHARRQRLDWPPNPGFGRLSREQWGRLSWLHVDHHLRQFGV